MVEGGEDGSEDFPGDDQADEAGGGGVGEFGVFLGGGRGEEEEGKAGAVQGRDGEEIEGEQEEIQGEADADEGCGDVANAGLGPADGLGGGEDGGRFEPAGQHAEADGEGGEKHQDEIGGGAGHGHPGGAAGIAVGPEWVEGGAGPADHPAAHDKGKDGNDHHSEWLAHDVWGGIEGDLAAAMGGVVAEFEGNEGVAGFVDGQGEEKDEIPGGAVKEGDVVKHGGAPALYLEAGWVRRRVSSCRFGGRS